MKKWSIDLKIPFFDYPDILENKLLKKPPGTTCVLLIKEKFGSSSKSQ